jgi:putative restriction endonuclease
MATDYSYVFVHLHRDYSPARWPAMTRHGAPHKPFLLLVVMDLIAHGQITTNFIQFNAELIDAFDLYWRKLLGDGNRSVSAVLPFYHLQSDGFWHLAPVPGKELALQAGGQIRTLGKLHELVLGATLDGALYRLLCESGSRDELRGRLIEAHFDIEARPILLEVGQIAAESYQYGLEMLNSLDRRFKLEEAPGVDARYHTEARSTAFRRQVLRAYDHTCAFCGVRLLTPEGRTAVEAAHIVPWTHSHNDDPRNGLALCGLHHWTFDEGLVTLSTSYQLEVSPIACSDGRAEPVVQLAGRPVGLPAEPVLHPAVEAIRWHRRNIFRRDAPEVLL